MLVGTIILHQQVRSYLRNRAGLPPVTIGMGVGILNQGHHSLYERVLVILCDVLPKEAQVHDGLQLLDGRDDSRHTALPAPVPGPVGVSHVLGATTDTPVLPVQPVLAAHTPPPARHEAPSGPVLRTPPHAVRLSAIPPGIPVLPGTQAAREAARGGHCHQEEEEGEEKEEEILPFSNEYAAQRLVVRLCRAARASCRPGVWMALLTPSSRTGQEYSVPLVACLAWLLASVVIVACVVSFS